jgi:hypothetical protein
MTRCHVAKRRAPIANFTRTPRRLPSRNTVSGPEPSPDRRRPSVYFHSVRVEQGDRKPLQAEPEACTVRELSFPVEMANGPAEMVLAVIRRCERAGRLHIQLVSRSSGFAQTRVGQQSALVDLARGGQREGVHDLDPVGQHRHG